MIFEWDHQIEVLDVREREREVIKIFTYMLTVKGTVLGHYLSLLGKGMAFPLPQSHDPTSLSLSL